MRFASAPIGLIVFNIIYKMDSKIGFEMNLIVVEAIRGRWASFMVLTETVSEIFGGQTTPSILVVQMDTVLFFGHIRGLYHY